VGKLLSLSKIPFTKLDNLKPLRKKLLGIKLQEQLLKQVNEI